MLPVNPPPPVAQPVSLYPTNVYFIDRFSPKQYLTRRGIRVRGLSSSSPKTTVGGGEILPNALYRRNYPSWRGGGFSLGVDLGASRTGLALGKGFCPRPLTVAAHINPPTARPIRLWLSVYWVLNLRGKKLEMHLLKIAEMEVDEFIIGLPKSYDGKETQQSNKVRSIAGRIAVQAAERGWRVYLQNEYGTSVEALDLMIERRLKRSVRQGRIDAYSALMLLERYFSTSGGEAELVLPKQLDLQEKLRRGSYQDNLEF
ncbi:hypothetical protein IEQ34_014089 [Dendrobium chrysotoxum]|uniref:YqgF/RNase H-like domain-containing protein n=1 Tax=Dendrobium chrysotoxum TaxID=161865 RepID=A0AAV7GL11_DENCH|nr:hypothetical protein IEQ34_014089 [Dendrobium chrysotoxum]